MTKRRAGVPPDPLLALEPGNRRGIADDGQAGMIVSLERP
jgi:hypothetical protein